MKNTLWFRRKTYGWGWTPITWQGWLITAVFVLIPLLVKFAMKQMGYDKSIQNFALLAVLPLIVVGLTAVCLRFGEKPKWQWGVKATKLSHIDLFVSDYKKSVLFYDMILISLGWEKMTSRTDYTAYSDGTLKIILSPVEKEFASAGYDRRRVGLNHLAIYAKTKEIVDQFHKEVLLANGVEPLFSPGPAGDKDYYSVYFEDPDKIKLEVVYAPFYCDRGRWPNTVENNFDPYL